MVHYKLYYFDVRGLGEVIRLLLQYKGEKYEDERFTHENWDKIKSKFPYGKVPVLEVDGKQLAESFAIARYLAKQFNLAGKDAWEQAKVDEFADLMKDAFNEFIQYFRVVVGFGEGNKDALHRDVFLPAIAKYYPIYVKTLHDSGSGFVVKSGLTWADFLLSEHLHTVHHMHPEALKKYPELEQYLQRIQQLPQIKKYIEGRKHTPL